MDLITRNQTGRYIPILNNFKKIKLLNTNSRKSRTIEIIENVLKWIEDESYSPEEMIAKCREIGLSDSELQMFGYGYLISNRRN